MILCRPLSGVLLQYSSCLGPKGSTARRQGARPAAAGGSTYTGTTLSVGAVGAIIPYLTIFVGTHLENYLQLSHSTEHVDPDGKIAIAGDKGASTGAGALPATSEL